MPLGGGNSAIAHPTSRDIGRSARDATREAAEQQDVAFALMISLGMVVPNIFAECSPQGAFSEQNELGQTLVLC